MAVSSDQINGLIDANLPDATDRRNKASTVRTLLKMVTNWVRDAVNNNLSSWLRVGDNLPGGNGDTVYHTGKLLVGRTSDDGRGVLQVTGSISSSLPNLADIDSGAAVVILGDGFGFDPRLLMLGGLADGTGFIRSTTSSSSGSVAKLAFYIANIEVMKIINNGNVGIGLSLPTERLHVAGNMQVDGFIRAGSGNKAFKITGVKSGSGLTLKTGRYLELTLEDGTIVKVAEVN